MADTEGVLGSIHLDKMTVDERYALCKSEAERIAKERGVGCVALTRHNRAEMFEKYQVPFTVKSACGIFGRCTVLLYRSPEGQDVKYPDVIAYPVSGADSPYVRNADGSYGL